jgi:hypothetical protein
MADFFADSPAATGSDGDVAGAGAGSDTAGVWQPPSSPAAPDASADLDAFHGMSAPDHPPNFFSDSPEVVALSLSLSLSLSLVLF